MKHSPHIARDSHIISQESYVLKSHITESTPHVYLAGIDIPRGCRRCCRRRRHFVLRRANGSICICIY